MALDKDLLELIVEYRARAAEACRLLREHLHLEDLTTWRRQVPQVGALGEGRYAFHGIGVSVVFGDGTSINFDFGFDGRCDGFSPWKIADVARQLGGKYMRFADWQKLERLLDDAVARGYVQQPFKSKQDDLYYLAAPPN